MTSAPAVMVVRSGAVTPCCERVPLTVGGGSVACRGCGELYRDARAVIEAVFGACVDVTPLTPSRYVARQHRIMRVGG